MQIIDTRADLQWVQDVHLPSIECSGFALAVIHGNKDSPDAIDLYAVDDYRERPVRYVADDTGEFARQRKL